MIIFAVKLYIIGKK